MTLTSLPAPPITQTCRQRRCSSLEHLRSSLFQPGTTSRPAPLAQPVEAPVPLPRSGIACLPAHCQWPKLTVATCSSSGSFVHTAPGYLCPCLHSQAVMVWTDTHAVSRQRYLNILLVSARYGNQLQLNILLDIEHSVCVQTELLPALLRGAFAGPW